MSKFIQEQSLNERVRSFLKAWVLFSFSDRLKFGIKVSLSLTIAFMIPMAMGWSQPQTAAITVMLIATAGVVGESVMKGAARVAGTLIGGIIGMTLIAMFPQDRMVYLMLLSVFATFFLYMYHVYQGDGTVYMLTAMMIMMVYTGEIDDTFLYGVDRIYMTVFGIVIYTLVGLFLWPVRGVDSTVEDALELTALQGELFVKVLDNEDMSGDAVLLDKIKVSELKLQHSHVTARENSLSVMLNASAWNTIAQQYKNISTLLGILSTHVATKESHDYADYIEGYTERLSEIEMLFQGCEKAWQDQTLIVIPQSKENVYKSVEPSKLSNLQKAAIATHAESVRKIHQALCVLADMLNVLQGEEATRETIIHVKAQPRYVWLDREYLKGAVQTFLIYWFAVAMWIAINPPGGFLIVLLATLLSVMTSFSLLKPSLLTILFSVGFVFATLMYIFVLPNLVYGWQLALFFMAYTFIAFYVINPKMSVFFLLGMFIMGISNTMSYNFGIFLTTMLIFYMFLGILMLFYYVPFSTKPEYLFVLMKKRFFSYTTALLTRLDPSSNWLQKKLRAYYTFHLVRTAEKLTLWASQVDTGYFKANSKENLMAFAAACSHLANLLVIVAEREEKAVTNPIYSKIDLLEKENVAADIASCMIACESREKVDTFFVKGEALIEQAEIQIDQIKETLNLDKFTQEEIVDFYINIDLRHSIWIAMQKCHTTMNSVDFDDLQKSRF